jgi:hypothetical protein
MKMALGLTLTLVSGLAIASAPNHSLFDLISAHVTTDGKWSVACRNGKIDTVTAEELSNGNVCSNAAATTNGSRIISMQRMETGHFDIVCRNLSHEVAPPEDLYTTRLCLAGGEDFYGGFKSTGNPIGFGRDTFYAMPFEVKKAMKVGTYGFVVPSRSVDPHIRFAIYSDKNGAPGSLVAESDTFVLDLPQRYEFPGRGESLAAGQYWLGWVLDGEVYGAFAPGNLRVVSSPNGFGSGFPKDFTAKTEDLSPNAVAVYLLPATE